MTILRTGRLRLEPIDDHHFDGLQAMNRLLMHKLGMRYRGEESWYERPHAVWEITRKAWQERPARP